MTFACVPRVGLALRALELHEATSRRAVVDVEAEERADLQSFARRCKLDALQLLGRASPMPRRKSHAAPDLTTTAGLWRSPMRQVAEVRLPPVKGPSPIPATERSQIRGKRSLPLDTSGAADKISELQSRIAFLHSEQEAIAEQQQRRWRAQRRVDGLAAQRTLAVARATERDRVVSHVDRVALQNTVLHEEVVTSAELELRRGMLRLEAQRHALRHL
jgi:hypothetical protein